MKNILNQKPNMKVKGRLRFTLRFVEDTNLRNKKILDIGCGYGWFEWGVLKRGVKKIAGIEITNDDLKTAKENINNSKAEFKVGGALKIPYKDGSFDTVVAWEVIEHIPKNMENEMFKEVRRVLAKKGYYYLSTPNKSIISNLTDPAWWLTGHRHYSKEMLSLLGDKNGFKLEEVYIKGRFWTLINLWNMYFSKWILRRKPIFDSFIASKYDKEYDNNKNGVMGIFVKYKRLS